MSTTIKRDWLSKSLAGLLLGFGFAIGCAGLFMSLAHDTAAPVRAQLAMWLTVPVWMGVLGGCFAFRSGARAWLWLGALDLLVLGVPVAARLF